MGIRDCRVLDRIIISGAGHSTKVIVNGISVYRDVVGATAVNLHYMTDVFSEIPRLLF